MDCPVDGSTLTRGASCLECGSCRGGLYDASELDEQFPGYRDALRIETDLKSGAFDETRYCPACHATFAPHRYERMLSWVDRCPSCDTYWLDHSDRQNANRIRGLAARQRAVASMSTEDQKEMAAALAESVEGEPSIHPIHQIAALFGFPVVQRIERHRSPVATTILATVLVLVFVTGGIGQTVAWAYDTRAPTLWTAFSANFVHFGWMHLLGNVYFLLAFGDAIEQRTSRAVAIGVPIVFGTFTVFVEGLFHSNGTIIAGASGFVSVIVGMAIMLQPQARVVTGLFAYVFRIPILGYFFLFAGHQFLMFMFGVTGVAWISHLLGIILGVMFGWVLAKLVSK